MEIHGTVAAGFEPAAQAFRENFERRGELGASFCAYHRGRVVVDLWAGFTGPRRRSRWRAETLCVIFSATKGLAAAAVLHAAHRGLLSYDAPVADLWPELARGRLAELTLRDVMNHRSGLVAVEEPVGASELADPRRLAPILERQEPLWTPGSRQGYHGVTYGLYVAEIFRRAVGRTLGQWLREEIAGPLDADVFLGLPPEQDPRVATLVPVGRIERLLKLIPHALKEDNVERRLVRALLDRRSFTTRAFAQPAAFGARGLQVFNEPSTHRLELAWASALASARGLARVYAVLASGGALDGFTLCDPDAITSLCERQSWQDPDLVLRKAMGWSQGFLKEEGGLFSPNPEAFGHPGAGGALGFCDPSRQLAWAYVMNRMDFRLRSPRAVALSQSLYRSPAIADAS